MHTKETRYSSINQWALSDPSSHIACAWALLARLWVRVLVADCTYRASRIPTSQPGFRENDYTLQKTKNTPRIALPLHPPFRIETWVLSGTTFHL
jgi:hypothetical protein